jgi:hypothetical protein
MDNEQLNTASDSASMANSVLIYCWVIGMSTLGGIVHFIHRVRTEKDGIVNYVMELIGEITTSIFCGFVTFFLCQSAELNLMETIAYVSLSSHMGTRMLYLLEQFFLKRVKKWLEH